MSTLEKRANVFILTITGEDDHRLNPTLLDSLTTNLAKLRAQSNPNSVLITTSQGKFFSNGFDLACAGSDPRPNNLIPASRYSIQETRLTEMDKSVDGLDNSVSARDSIRKTRLELMDSKLRSLVHDILTLPMPTIAAITGHASAGGMVLAVSHDYIIMRRDRGFLYMSEMDIGMVIPGWFVSLFNSKIGSPKVLREVLMAAAKVTAERGVEMGIVDAAVEGAAETLEAAVRLGEELVGRKWDGHVYADNRRIVFAEVLSSLKFDDEGNKVISKL